jgi:hypothetical protein
MNNCCICWFSRIFLLGILIFKGLTARRLNKLASLHADFQTLQYSRYYGPRNINYDDYYVAFSDGLRLPRREESFQTIVLRMSPHISTHLHEESVKRIENETSFHGKMEAMFKC